MKKLSVVLAVLSFLALAQVGQAVELENDWYVKFGEVSLVGHYPQQNVIGWYPASNLGQFDSLLVEDGGSDLWHGRTITVTQDMTVSPGVLFEDFGSDTTYYPYYDAVEVSWETYYDASRLQLQVFRHHEGIPDELVWSQTESGYATSNYLDRNIWNSYPLRGGESVIFRLVAVPEPATLIPLASGLTMLFCYLRRKQQ